MLAFVLSVFLISSWTLNSGQAWPWLTQIRAPQTHAFSTGNDVTVAVIDTGVDLAHPHFVGTTLTVYNAQDGSLDVNDGCGHGTAVAGVVVDVAPDVDLLVIKASDDDCYGSTQDIADAVDYAVAREVRIIVITLAIALRTVSLESSIAAASAADVLVIASVGNKANDNPLYPAAYPAVMGVGGVNGSDQRWVRSNFGVTVDVVAPAEAICAPRAGGDYTCRSGTSLAAPQVAGLAALLLQRFPDMTASALRDRIQESALDLGDSGPDLVFGYGRIDVFSAVTWDMQSLYLPSVRQEP